MNLLEVLIIGIIGYLFGSISFARLITKLLASEDSIDNLFLDMEDQDLSQLMTGFGANRAAMVLGAKWGIAIGLLDMLKVVIPMIFVGFLFLDESYFLIVSITGLIGHNWPLYYRFKGGRGFSVIYGSFFAIDWIGAIITVILGLLFGMGIFGTVMIGYVGWLWLMIPWFLLRTNDSAFLIYAILINIIFIIGTIPEIRLGMRLRKAGKFAEYQEKLFQSSPRWRGMKKMNDRIQSPIVRGFLVLIGLILLFPVYFFILV